MDITRALGKGILQQPVNDIHNMRVIGFHGIQLTEFNHLLQVTQRTRRQTLGRGLFDGVRHRVKLVSIASNISWTGQRPHNCFSDLRLLNHTDPAGHIGLTAKDQNFSSVDFNRQDLVAPGKLAGHNAGN